MRMYETIYIVNAELSDDEVKAVTAKVQDVLASQQGELVKLEDWGVRKLAYPIQKCQRGRYFYLRFDGNAALIAELERRLRLDDKVLRYQSVKLEQEPTPVPAEKKAAAPAAEPAAE